MTNGRIQPEQERRCRFEILERERERERKREGEGGEEGICETEKEKKKGEKIIRKLEK